MKIFRILLLCLFLFGNIAAGVVFYREDSSADLSPFFWFGLILVVVIIINIRYKSTKADGAAAGLSLFIGGG